MNISKISRSIIVAIFVVCIIFLGYLDIISMLQRVESPSTVTGLMKVGYGIVLLVFVLLYVYMKDKLYRMKVKRKLSFVYRYIYLILAIVGVSIYLVYQMIYPASGIFIASYVAISLAVAFCIKKVVFNTSKSDILSVFGMFAVTMMPAFLTDRNTLINSMCIALIVVVTLLILQLLIDELKQRGIKTKKYLWEACILGVGIGICMLFSIHLAVFAILCLVLLLITTRLDNTHISFPKRVMASITQEQREQLYRIERINISKLVISCVVALAIGVIVFMMGKWILGVLPETITQTPIVTQIEQNIEKTQIGALSFSDGKGNVSHIYQYAKALVGLSKSYYMTIFIYIILVELLALILKRKYDTKSTVLKAFFILLFCFAAVFQINIYLMQPILTILLILIAIVNTSNIYLNREERVKMLVAS